jgi:prolipoprotein diacylglyceryltransferase
MAYTICTIWAVQRGKRYNINNDQVQGLVTLALISGLIGSRICHVLLYPENYHSWLDFLKIYNGGLVLYGFLFTTHIPHPKT